MEKWNFKYVPTTTSRRRDGFTLIELLVVIAIIGVLSSIVLASLNTARAKARDARRIADLRQIKIALELYRDDNGQYPSFTGGYTFAFLGSNVGAASRWETLRTDLLSYIQLPTDPTPVSGGNWPIVGETITYKYAYSSDGNEYSLVTRLETDNPNACKNVHWKVNFPFPLHAAGTDWCPTAGGAWDLLYSDH